MASILLIFAAMAAQPGATPAAAPIEATAPAELQSPVLAFIDAIAKRDVLRVRQRLSRTTEPQILYYWGETVAGANTIAQWHKEWFAEKGWTIEAGPLGHSLVDGRLAVLSHDVRYKKAPGREFLIRLGYTLVNEAGEWKIARVQQTLLEGPQ